ncbi:MAG: hypothetical protein LBR20_03610 [Propionibacteriaceae bacterium]|jgi:hypothetical protein|nr:hypothetical protein [Propionibacteriaceae bacterium]
MSEQVPETGIESVDAALAAVDPQAPLEERLGQLAEAVDKVQQALSE